MIEKIEGLKNLDGPGDDVFAPEEKKKVSLRVSRSETSLKGNILPLPRDGHSS